MKCLELKELVNIFSKNAEIKEIIIKTNDSIELSGDEFYELTKDKKFVNTSVKNAIFTVEFEQNEFTKFLFKYEEIDDIAYVKEIKMWREV